LKLKKIIIIGFKSFADKTTLDFTKGITGVVGPNGCGKSNIADAFRWVLGEQSAKSMRGHKMNDVIFAGTTKRQPLNFAEVTIVLSDVQGALPIDYEELAITRRLHRSGESDYFINQQPVRLKDVQSLFFDSGVGKNAFSIFEQGKIDQVINYSPLERRYIFEEAAGIVRFLQRKREALKKLEQVDLNISRVKDIHQEIEKQIIILEEQAEKARIYKEKKALLGTLEKGVLVAKWEGFEKRSGEASQREQEQTQQLAETAKAFASLEKQTADAKQKLSESEKALTNKTEELFKARSKKEITTRENQSSRDRLQEILIQEKKLNQELIGLKEAHKERQGERAKSEKLQKETEKRQQALEKELKASRDKVQAQEQEVTGKREQLKKTQQEQITLLQSESQIEMELKQNKLRQENTLERMAALQKRKQEIGSLIDTLMTQAAEKQKLVREASEGIDQQKLQFNGLEKQIQELTLQTQQVQTELNEISQELTENRARQKVLMRMRDEMEGFSAGSKRLLQESNDPKSPLYKKLQGLHEHIQSESGGEKALAIALRPYMHTLVVKSREQLRLVVDFARSKNLKDFSLLCTEGLPTASDKKSLKGLANLLAKVVDSKLAAHFLKDHYIAGSVDEALKAVEKQEGIEILTEDGLYIDKQQVLFFSVQGENNLFAREAELKTLDAKLKANESEKQKLELAVKTLQNRKNETTNLRNELDKEMRRCEMKLIEHNFALQRVNGDLEKMRHEGKQIDQELTNLALVSEKYNLTIAQLTQKHQEAVKQAGSAHKLFASLDSELTKMADKFSGMQRELQEKEAAYQKAAQEHQQLLHTLNLFQHKEEESLSQEKRIEETLANGKEAQKKIQSMSTTFQQDLEQIESALAAASKACQEQEQAVAKQKEQIAALEKKGLEARDKAKNLENSKAQLEMQAAQCLSSRQAIELELQERYHLPINDARRLYSPLEKPLDQTERQVRSLRQELEAFGDINMTSIEECDKHKVRHEFLNRQVGDLNGSKQELIQIITELDKESRKIFKETFEVIRNNFKKNFKILFNGGEADLQFTETQDLLEAGIEIIAQPPGKQMRSINLLSGGEKCMTAMALLFAIFEVKPAPFCILDEIDAPLDDSNVTRFVNVVKQFVDRCQFIIITHNKCTMAIADVLFGVSMEERGVSKLLSMELTDETAPQPEPVLV
jgi:chromosome segregation protein